MRPHDHADPPVEIQPERVLLGRQLAVEVDQADRRERLRRGRLIEKGIRVSERVFDGLHERAALQVDDRDLRPIQGVVHAQAPPRHLVRAVVVRSKHPVRGIEVRIDLALVPDVIPARDDVDAGGKDRVSQRRRQPHPTRDVLAVGGDEVDPAGGAQSRQHLLDRVATRLADQVADHQDAARPGRTRRIAVGRVAQARQADLRGPLRRQTVYVEPPITRKASPTPGRAARNRASAAPAPR